MNTAALDLWADVLQQVAQSRIMILAPAGSARERILARFADAGVEGNRIDFVSRRPRREYLQLYHHIDLGLDTFPYNGHTTSLDALWMGVPVVTMVGQTPVSRAGWCHLSNLGLTEFAATTPEQFVHIAVGLARDLPRLGDLRHNMRAWMEASPLMNAPLFARDIEDAYRAMWRAWCTAPANSGP